MQTVELFNRFEVEYNVLSVVTGQNAMSIRRMYRLFSKQNFRYLQFIPCLEPLEEEARDGELPPVCTGIRRLFDQYL